MRYQETPENARVMLHKSILQGAQWSSCSSEEWFECLGDRLGQCQRRIVLIVFIHMESVTKRAACVFRLNCRLICNYQVVICIIDLCMCIAHSCHSITWLLCVECPYGTILLHNTFWIFFAGQPGAWRFLELFPQDPGQLWQWLWPWRLRQGPTVKSTITNQRSHDI